MAFELRHGACQAFSRPQPRSSNLQEIPQVAAFAKSSVERGIATEEFQELLQVWHGFSDTFQVFWNVQHAMSWNCTVQATYCA